MTAIRVPVTTYATIVVSASTGLNQAGANHVNSLGLGKNPEALKAAEDEAFKDASLVSTSYLATVVFPEGYHRYTQKHASEEACIRAAKRLVAEYNRHTRDYLKTGGRA